MHTVIPIVSAERNCDGCTVCCDGWLAGKANEHYFYPGQKCHYVSDNGCTIYEDRPEIPCKTFSCGWLLDKEIPEWMKPSNIQAVIISTEDGSFKTQRKTVSLKVFSWLNRLYRQGKIKTTQSEEEFLFLWDLFYDPLECSSVRRYATPRKDLPLSTIRSILKQAGL